MKDIADNTTLDKEEETVEMLKDKGFTFKGASKAFTTFLVLWFLSKRDMHGYMIMKEIDTFFKPQINHGVMKKTKANKVYPLLKSMKENNLIQSYNGTHKKKEVKIYKLTDEGKKFYDVILKDCKLNLQRKIWKELMTDLDIELKE